MEYFVDWCLTCERRIEPGKVYCSLQCKHEDHYRSNNPSTPIPSNISIPTKQTIYTPPTPPSLSHSRFNTYPQPRSPSSPTSPTPPSRRQSAVLASSIRRGSDEYVFGSGPYLSSFAMRVGESSSPSLPPLPEEKSTSIQKPLLNVYSVSPQSPPRTGGEGGGSMSVDRVDMFPVLLKRGRRGEAGRRASLAASPISPVFGTFGNI